jgi:hypothetical protein
MLIKYRKNKKIIPLIVYIALAMIYAIVHHLFVRNFNSYSSDNFGYSTFKELFYIARLTLPVILMFITIDFEFTFEDIKKDFCIVACIVGTVIVFSNIFKIGLGSYTNLVIKDNIFGWFTGAYTQYSFYELASKGWFNFANQISALLILLTLITIYAIIKKMSVYNVYNVVVMLLSMLMIGTKVALYGMFLALIALIAIFIVSFISKRKFEEINKYSAIIMLILTIAYIGMMKFSPANNRAQINSYIAENREKEDDEDDENTMEILNKQLAEVKTHSYDEKVEFIEENYEKYSIDPMFIEDSYSYKLDPEFWLEEFEKPLADRLNYRRLEEEMIKRVVEVNGDSNSKWFGISYMRVQNIFNIERDFVLQYYTIGIVGLLLFIIIPFCIPVLVIGIYMLKNRKNILNVENMIMIASILLVLAIAYFSGNVIDSLIITIYLSFIIGVLINNTIIKNRETLKLSERNEEDKV